MQAAPGEGGAGPLGFSHLEEALPAGGGLCEAGEAMLLGRCSSTGGGPVALDLRPEGGSVARPLSGPQGSRQVVGWAGFRRSGERLGWIFSLFADGSLSCHARPLTPLSRRGAEAAAVAALGELHVEAPTKGGAAEQPPSPHLSQRPFLPGVTCFETLRRVSRQLSLGGRRQ